MLFHDLVDAAAAAASTRARNTKISLLADVLGRAVPGEIEAAVGLLVADPRQGRLNVGWATVSGLRTTPAMRAELTVSDVDDVLSTVAASAGAGSVGQRVGALEQLFVRATAAEADFLRRLLVGELRLGALEGVVAEAIARAANVPSASVRRAWMLTGDLRRTARLALMDGREALDAVGLVVGTALAPMLATTAQSFESAVSGFGQASVESKLDGARIQVHRDGELVRLFTRNLNDITHRLPEVVEIVMKLPVQRIVLDGEVVGLHEDEAERPLPFQNTMSAFGRDDHMSRSSSLVPAFFDCLHVDGLDLIDEPLTERLRVLTEVSGPWRVPGIVTGSPEEASAFLERALASGHEGVMVKALDAPYEAGRRGKSWLKVKPVRTFDLVVLAAEWGHGRRRGWLSNLHLGALDPSGGPPIMVGKTFKGMTDAMLAWQTERLLSLETGRDGIVVFVRPELLAEIALDGVQRSTRYAGGLAMRFARVKRYREDKPVQQADTIDALRALLP